MGMQHVVSAGLCLAALCVTSYGAYIHDPGLPSGVASEVKATGSFIYLEPESPTAGANDTLKDSTDAGHTFYRTGTSPVDAFWGSTTTDYNGYRNISRGTDTASVSGLSITWENIATGVAEGAYDVYVRAYPTGNGSQTFSLSASDSAANLASGSSTGSATTSIAAGARLLWLKLGTVNLASDTDTFQLSIATTASTVRFDTVLLVAAVPEPASLTMLGLGAVALLARKRK